MRVRRRFQFALLVTLLFAAGFEAIPRTIAAINAVKQRRELALARSAIAHVRLPQGFRRTSSGCSFYPCYLSTESSTLAAKALPATLASLHAQWQRARPLCRAPAATLTLTCAITGTLQGQLITVLLTPAPSGSLIEIAGP
jgi:hypothetical protein